MSQRSLIEEVEETGSTNADLLACLAAGEDLSEGFWLRANRQSGGRGRLGRQWDSGSGNLLCSTIVHLKPGDPSASTLSLVAGLAVYDTVKTLLLPDTPVLLKWPNDILIGDAKVAGILLERHANSVVVGIGINLHSAPDLPDRKTTTIGYENGKFANGPEKVLPILGTAMRDWLSHWRTEPLSQTLLEWTVRSHRYDDRIRITHSNGEVVHAHYRGIDRDGALKVQPLGEHETIVHAGDVTLKWHDKE